MTSPPPLALIVAHDHRRLIGRHGDLPWRLPNDLKHFKARTLGNTVIMGRKTWDSLPKKPLPGRHNRVLTRDRDFRAEGAEVLHTLEDALRPPTDGALFVIGGAELYALALPLVQRLHVTEVDFPDSAGSDAASDTFFPAYDRDRYLETAREEHARDATHAFAYRFLTLERRDEARS